MNVNENAKLLRPHRVGSSDDLVAAATSEGKPLLFPITELPQLARGKGVQTIKIHRTPIAPERVVATAVLPPDGTLVVHAGKRYTNLKPADLESYIGKRAQRGLKLPRGFQSVGTIRAWTDREPRSGEPNRDLVM